MDVISALHLWASIERHGHDSVGFYSEQPWYLPSGYRETAPGRSDADYLAAERVAGIVLKIAQNDAVRASALRLYYGAFPGAHEVSKNQRAKMFHHEHGISARDYYRLKDEAERIVEGALNYG